MKIHITFILLVVVAAGMVVADHQCGVCTRESQPVCAQSPSKGFQTFNNRCLMDDENLCKRGDYEFKHTGSCA